MWVTSPPLEVQEAKAALREAVPNLDECLKNGQIEIISYDEWYLLGGKFDCKRVLQGWVDKEKLALKHGFEGLRLTGNTLWLERDLWRSFVDYEEAVNSVIGKYRMLALCTYCIKNCSGSDVVDVIRNHMGTLVKQGYDWFLMEDSSKRRAVNGALKLSEQRYSALFDNMQDGFAYHKVLFDKSGRPLDYVFLEINDAFEKLTGLKKSDLLGKRATIVLPGIEKDPADWIGVYGKVAKTGEPTRFENYSVNLDRWYMVSAFSFEKGYFAATFEDITRRKKSEQALRENELRLKRSQEIAHLGSWELEVVSGSLAWSDEVYRIFGLKPQEFEATYCAFLDSVHPDDRDSVDSAYTGSLRENKDSYEIEHRVIRKDTGEVRVVYEKCTHIRDDSGKIIRSVGMVHDITERKVVEEALRRSEQAARSHAKELEEMQAKLEEKAAEVEAYATRMEELAEERALKLKDAERLAAIGQTAGMVGHDIRNPLQSIMSDVYLVNSEVDSLPDGESKVVLKESLDEIGKSVEYVNKIVADLQDYTRPLRPVFQEADLREICNDLLAKKSNGGDIRTDCLIDENARLIKTDHGMLKRVLENLVVNAVQAMPDGGSLTIRAIREASGIFVYVQDTGAGMPEEVKDKIFSPLFTTKSKGQGFGLAVVKRLVEGLNGKVTFMSEKGKGTTFIIHLPS